MRGFTKSGSIAQLSFVFFAAFPTAAFAQLDTPTLTGQLILGNRGYDCQYCEVRLENGGIPAGFTYADSLGHFRFDGVRPGMYVIRVSLPGFEEVRQPVEVMPIGNVMTMVMLNQNGDTMDDAGSPHIVDVSQLVEIPKKAKALYKKALSSEKKGEKEEAIALYEEATRIAPSFYDAHNRLGILHRDADRFNDAEAAFLRAAELNQSSVEPLVHLSGLYIEENLPERAVEVSEEAVKRDSRSAAALFNLGLALYKMSSMERAEDVLKKAFSLAPEISQVRLVLANIYLGQARYDSVMEQLNNYLAENPDSAQRVEVEEMRQKLITAKEAEKP
jgi:Flp pilus assembly protein TadD